MEQTAPASLRERLRGALSGAVRRLAADRDVTDPLPPIQLDRPRDPAHGDFSCNAAMMWAKTLGQKPRDAAQALIERIDFPADLVAGVEVAGAGFINLRLAPAAYGEVLRGVLRGHGALLEDPLAYGRSRIGEGRGVLLEFVSANPTGPMHVGQGRWAAVGDTLGNLLTATGHAVIREYYINDAGKQIELMAQSVAALLLEQFQFSVPFPEDGYRGDYIKLIADAIADQIRPILYNMQAPLTSNALKSILPEQRALRLIANGIYIIQKQSGGMPASVALEAFPSDALEALKREAEADVITLLESVLEKSGVKYDVWYSERERLHEPDPGDTTGRTKVQQALEALRERGHVYEAEGAVWLKATDFGDRQDWVLVTSDGRYTYFLVDIAYHMDKIARMKSLSEEKGLTDFVLINIWGQDHHSHVARMKAAVAAAGEDSGCLEVIIGQLVALKRDGEAVRMSKRAGAVVTFDELLEEVGKDAVRLFFLLSSVNQAMEFDVDQAKAQSDENPVYYLQYAHTRVASIRRHAAALGVTLPERPWEVDLAPLADPTELALLRLLEQFPSLVEESAVKREPHHLPHFGLELARAFHHFYHVCRVLPVRPPADGGTPPALSPQEIAMSRARLALCEGVRIVIKALCDLMGVSAPTEM